MARESTLAPDFLSSFIEDPDPVQISDILRDLEEDSGLRWMRRRSEAPRPWEDRISRRLIRAMDLVLSVLFLIAFSPFMAILALAIKLETPGPVLFNQRRIGKGGRNFMMFKFRSMFHEKSPGAIRLTEESDARVTRLGGFIRRHHIDEALQFLNVLRGDMSLVGPRPELPSVADLGQTRISGYSERQAATPGITGLAQILNGYDGNLGELRQTVALDSYWIRHRSPLNYLRVLWRTIPVVLRGSERA